MTSAKKSESPAADQVYAAPLTAAGRGAVASIRAEMSPQTAARLFADCFQPAGRQQPATAAVDRLLFGSWRSEEVVIVRIAPTVWEIHCHGGSAAVRRILQDLTGDQNVASSRTRPLLEAQLFTELLRTRTQQTAALVLAQSQGLLRNFLQQLAAQPSPQHIAAQLQGFTKWQRLCSHLSQPWQVAVVGQPNAGKSSLLNAIVGYERSIVFDQPGTTRDRVEVEIVLAGWPFRLTDTAGIRETADHELEASGIALARESVSHCDACLLVVDAVKGWSADDQQLLVSIPERAAVAILLNKTDRVPSDAAKPVIAAGTAESPPVIFSTSATTGEGISAVLEWLPKMLMPQLPNLDSALPACGCVVDLCQTLTEQISAGEPLQTLRDSIQTVLQR